MFLIVHEWYIYFFFFFVRRNDTLNAGMLRTAFLYHNNSKQNARYLFGIFSEIFYFLKIKIANILSSEQIQNRRNIINYLFVE